MSKKSARKSEKSQIDRTIEEILDEKFVHNLSDLIYNRISTLWHIDRQIETLLSRITAKVVAGIFCIEYLSHIDSLAKQRLGITGLTDRNLTDSKRVEKIRKRLSKDRALAAIARKVVPLLNRIVEDVEAGNLDKVTQLAHAGNYLLSSLEDLRDGGHPDYTLWLDSLPYYYEKDLRYIGALGAQDTIMTSDDMDVCMEMPDKSQTPIELFSLKIKRPDQRINLNTSHGTEEGFFPCDPVKNAFE